MTKHKYIILGAGIGGLAAGAALKKNGENDFIILESKSDVPMNLHNGVHYLHSNNFGLPFDFELKKIQSTEEVWDPRTDTFKKTSNIPEMIEYSMKVMGTRHPSSIMDPGNRDWDTYLPLSNNMNDLLEAYVNYIGYEHFSFGQQAFHIDTKKKILSSRRTNSKNGQDLAEFEYTHIISTAPLPAMHDMCGIPKQNEFKNRSVFVTNYQTKNIVANWLIGIYVSDPKFPPYRITVLNNIISLESVSEMTEEDEQVVKYHLGRYFDYDLKTKQSYEWTTGRIFGLSKPEREKTLEKFSRLNIHMIGRFGQWDGKLIMDTTAIQAIKLVYKLHANN